MASPSGMPRAIILATLFLAASAWATLFIVASPGPSPTSADVQQTGYNATIVVNVTDDAGHFISGATVSILNLPGVTQTTNLTGVAVFTDLFADENVTTQYYLWASKTGYEDSVTQTVGVTPDNTSYADLELSAAILYGTVSDVSGPIEGATVFIAVLGYSAQTNADGNYELGGVTGGLTHSVTASAPGYVNQTENIYVDVASPDRLDFVLVSKTGSISGTVTHESTGDPLYRVNVSTIMPSGAGYVTVTVTTDLNGTYKIPNLPAGLYTVTASLEGFNSSTLSNISVVMDVDTNGVDFALDEKPTRLYGLVKAGTVLLVGVNVSVMDTSYYALSDLEGEYEIKNIPAGTYSLQVAREGYVSIIFTGVVVPRGGEREQNIELVGLPGALRGVVIQAGGVEEPLAGATVTIISSQGEERSRTTNINGEFEFTGLAPGNYTVQFELEGYKPREIGPVAITEEGSVDLSQVTLEPIGEGIGGFIPGLDLPHSMMVVALILTMVILALAAAIRVIAFESPERSPAVYDTEEEAADERAKEEGKGQEKAQAAKDEVQKEV